MENHFDHLKAVCQENEELRKRLKEMKEKNRQLDKWIEKSGKNINFLNRKPFEEKNEKFNEVSPKLYQTGDLQERQAKAKEAMEKHATIELQKCTFAPEINKQSSEIVEKGNYVPVQKRPLPKGGLKQEEPKEEKKEVKKLDPHFYQNQFEWKEGLKKYYQSEKKALEEGELKGASFMPMNSQQIKQEWEMQKTQKMEELKRTQELKVEKERQKHELKKSREKPKNDVSGSTTPERKAKDVEKDNSLEPKSNGQAQAAELAGSDVKADVQPLVHDSEKVIVEFDNIHKQIKHDNVPDSHHNASTDGHSGVKLEQFESFARPSSAIERSHSNEHLVHAQPTETIEVLPVEKLPEEVIVQGAVPTTTENDSVTEKHDINIGKDSIPPQERHSDNLPATQNTIEHELHEEVVDLQSYKHKPQNEHEKEAIVNLTPEIQEDKDTIEDDNKKHLVYVGTGKKDTEHSKPINSEQEEEQKVNAVIEESTEALLKQEDKPNDQIDQSVKEDSEVLIHKAESAAPAPIHSIVASDSDRIIRPPALTQPELTSDIQEEKETLKPKSASVNTKSSNEVTEEHEQHVEPEVEEPTIQKFDGPSPAEE